MLENLKKIFNKIKKFFQSQSSFSKKIITIAVILIVIFSSFYYFQKVKKQKEDILEKEIPVQETPKINTPKILYNLYGDIKEIEGSIIIFEAEIPQFDEINQGSFKKETREIIITPLTKFVHSTFVTDETTGKKIPKEVQITLDDFKIGSRIEVLSRQDISKAEKFEATKIRIIKY